MQTGYEDIDNLYNQTNQLYDDQMKQQQDIINTSTQQTIDEIERNKKKAEDEATKTNKALYTDYQKQINPYGINAENIAEQGLAGSGVSESAKTNYYNTYQNARTEAQNNANNIKADFDAQITQARQNGDLQLAQSALEMYQQKIQDLYNQYNLKFNRDQFNYQKEQDALSQSNWEKEYNQNLQQAQWEQQFNQAQFDYQKERDKVADSQWQQEYELSKKTSRSSSSSGGNYLQLNGNENTENNENYSKYEKMVNTISNDLNGIYKNNSDEFKQKAKKVISDRLSEAYNSEEISKEELKTLLNKMGIE